MIDPIDEDQKPHSFMKLQFERPKFDKLDKLSLALIYVSAFWLLMTVVIVEAPNMAKMQVGEPFPEKTPTEYHFVWNFSLQYDIDVSINGTRIGTIDVSFPLTILLSTSMTLLINRIVNWLRTKQNRKPD